MNDARTQAIQKAATELVQELLGTVQNPTPERWTNIVIRKMEQVPDRCPPKLVTRSPMLRIGSYLLSKLGERIVVSCLRPKPGWVSGLTPGGEEHFEIEHWEPKDIAKLKLWLNGE